MGCAGLTDSRKVLSARFRLPSFWICPEEQRADMTRGILGAEPRMERWHWHGSRPHHSLRDLAVFRPPSAPVDRDMGGDCRESQACLRTQLNTRPDRSACVEDSQGSNFNQKLHSWSDTRGNTTASSPRVPDTVGVYPRTLLVGKSPRIESYPCCRRCVGGRPCCTVQQGVESRCRRR